MALHYPVEAVSFHQFVIFKMTHTGDFLIFYRIEVRQLCKQALATSRQLSDHRDGALGNAAFPPVLLNLL